MAETRAERRRRVSSAGILLSCSSRRRASSSSGSRSGAFWTVARRSLMRRARALRWSIREPAAKTARATTIKTRSAISACSGRQSYFGPRFKQSGTEAGSISGQAIGKLRADPSGAEGPPYFSIFVDGATLEDKNILHGDGLTIHAGDLGNRDDLAGAVRETGHLDDGVNRGGDLMADGALGNIQVRHGNHV